MNLHQADKNRYEVWSRKEGKENQHPQPHSFLVLLIIFELADAIFIFANSFFCFGRDVYTTNTTMFVRGNVRQRLGTLWHVLDFLLHCGCIDHQITPVEPRFPQMGVLPMHLQSDGCLVHQERQFLTHIRWPN